LLIFASRNSPFSTFCSCFQAALCPRSWLSKVKHPSLGWIPHLDVVKFPSPQNEVVLPLTLRNPQFLGCCLLLYDLMFKFTGWWFLVSTPSEKYDFVSWDDYSYYPQYMKNKNKSI
jgi:hypothetical protein